MKNSTNIRIPKKYEKMIREIYHDEDDYWVELENGFIHGVDENSVIHEETSRGVLEEIKNIKKK